MPCAGAGGHREKVEAFCPRVTEIPFDAEEPFVVFVKGAPDLLLERCTRREMRGRLIFSNIRTFVYFLTSRNGGEIGAILLGTLLGWPMPLTAIQLLWMNLVTDGAPALSLGLEKGEPAVLILAVVYIPGLNTVFNAVPLSLLRWAYRAPLLFLPGVVDELTKLLQRTMERRGA
jgi:magnesium-transporting ATPase (P-type)